jgi:hypothetical protein
MKMKVGDFVKNNYHSTIRYGKIISVAAEKDKPGGFPSWVFFEVCWVNDDTYIQDMKLKHDLSNGRRGNHKRFYRADELTPLSITALEDTILKLKAL